MTRQTLLHTREQFALIASAPFEFAWPLFGADQERLWAPDWNPCFLWPMKPMDREGMVFKVMHGEKSAVWVNTAFERAAGRIQYVYVIPDVVLTVITLRLVPDGQKTRVEVIYERTALAEAANDIVNDMAESDRVAGEQWSLQINAYLRSIA